MLDKEVLDVAGRPLPLPPRLRLPGDSVSSSEIGLWGSQGPGTGEGGNCQHRTPPRRPGGATGRGEEVLVLDVSEWEQEEVLGFVGADERSHRVSKCPSPKIDDGMVSW